MINGTQTNIFGDEEIISYDTKSERTPKRTIANGKTSDPNAWTDVKTYEAVQGSGRPLTKRRSIKFAKSGIFLSPSFLAEIKGMYGAKLGVSRKNRAIVFDFVREKADGVLKISLENRKTQTGMMSCHGFYRWSCLGPQSLFGAYEPELVEDDFENGRMRYVVYLDKKL